MPHTIHLAAIKLLETIGALSSFDGDKASSKAGTYQNAVTAPVDRPFDDEAASFQDEESSDFLTEGVGAINKLRKVIRSIRASPQQRQSWLKEVRSSRAAHQGTNLIEEPVLMLILDVRTQWSSTHQMLRCALDYQEQIDAFVSRHRVLRDYELSEDEWLAVSTVTSWLKDFRLAATQMSATKRPMLSTTHAIFRGLQEHLKNEIKALPERATPELREGLVSTHLKLSEYYEKFDKSPYYIWAALLDPRISYAGIRQDFEGDDDLLACLDDAKQSLSAEYHRNYARRPTQLSSGTSNISRSSSVSSVQLMEGSPQKTSFTDRYNRRENDSINELEDYFKLRREDFNSCDPIAWWYGRRSQFPNLYRLARDILSIPGSAVAVERIFSGGRDTISLRRSSLNPDTIRTLMLMKHRLKLAREKVDKVL